MGAPSVASGMKKRECAPGPPSAGTSPGSRVIRGSSNRSSPSCRARSSSALTATRALNSPAARARSSSRRGSSSATQCRGEVAVPQQHRVAQPVWLPPVPRDPRESRTRAPCPPPASAARRPGRPGHTPPALGDPPRASTDPTTVAPRGSTRGRSRATEGSSSSSRRAGSASASIAAGSVSTRSPTAFSSGMCPPRRRSSHTSTVPEARVSAQTAISAATPSGSHRTRSRTSGASAKARSIPARPSGEVLPALVVQRDRCVRLKQAAQLDGFAPGHRVAQGPGHRKAGPVPGAGERYRRRRARAPRGRRQ